MQLNFVIIRERSTATSSRLYMPVLSTRSTVKPGIEGYSAFHCSATSFNVKLIIVAVSSPSFLW